MRRLGTLRLACWLALILLTGGCGKGPAYSPQDYRDRVWTPEELTEFCQRATRPALRRALGEPDERTDTQWVYAGFRVAAEDAVQSPSPPPGPRRMKLVVVFDDAGEETQANGIRLVK